MSTDKFHGLMKSYRFNSKCTLVDRIINLNVKDCRVPVKDRSEIRIIGANTNVLCEVCDDQLFYIIPIMGMSRHQKGNYLLVPFEEEISIDPKKLFQNNLSYEDIILF